MVGLRHGRSRHIRGRDEPILVGPNVTKEGMVQDLGCGHQSILALPSGLGSGFLGLVSKVFGRHTT